MTGTGADLEAGREIRAALTRAGDTVLARSADGEVARTGADLLNRAQYLAGRLVDRGLEHATIGVCFRNSAAALEAFIATELIGATRLPVEPSAAVAEARSIFEAGRADAVLTDGHHDDVPDDTDGWVKTELGPATLVHHDASPAAGSRWQGRVTVHPGHPLVVYPRAVRGGELFGIPTSYANWRAIIDVNLGLYRHGHYGPAPTGDDCYLTVVQLMHATGMVGSFPFLHLGLPQVLLPRFRAEAMIEAVERHRVTTLFAVPGMLTRVADALGPDGGHRLGSLRRVLYGGAPVPAAELARWQPLVGDTLCQLYGRYEAGWPLTVLTAGDHRRLLAGDEQVAGTCGRPVDAIELTVGRPEAGQRDGEVLTRSAMVSAEFADRDGWCGLGDTAVLTGEGYLRLTGRLDGMINTGSFHVYPDEVETAVLAHPAVSAARVVGVADPRWGETVVAFVVTSDHSLGSTLRDWLRQHLAPYKVPTVVHVVDRLPDN
ncbi:AMP-binding protein [Amycolatopsis rhabdoformis]|uniref:AMP-binding protein n=1 Tax=Amycolatopsis rhabdoformis TaxID=1448059 RepID=A0ABZ1IGU7_9PSEU|nr:AMP-binding protein [Amycolatopsis rhabdoformis]WSE33691.1 AMP-binding protein [Amycolatopsis rhabdoformis]